jgi:hypothetical protein
MNQNAVRSEMTYIQYTHLKDSLCAVSHWHWATQRELQKVAIQKSRWARLWN